MGKHWIVSGMAFLMLAGAWPAWSAEEKEEPPKLLGPIVPAQLGEDPYAEWYQKAYVEYEPNADVLQALRQENWDGVSITAFFGTWCGDSRREVPRLVKVLDLLEVPRDRFTLVAVDHVEEATKQSPGGEEKGLEVYKVPTIIVSRDGREVARYVEHAALSLERDLLTIVSGAPYEPSYITYPTVRRWLAEGVLADPNISPRGLAIQVRHEIQSERELLAAGDVLLSRNQVAEAVMLFRINTALYPESARSFASLARGLREMAEMKEAREMAEIALRLNTDPARVGDLVKLIDSTRSPEEAQE